MEWDEYIKCREFYQMRGREELAQGNDEECAYMTGVIRGLDLAMKVNYELNKEMVNGTV